MSGGVKWLVWSNPVQSERPDDINRSARPNPFETGPFILELDLIHVGLGSARTILIFILFILSFLCIFDMLCVNNLGKLHFYPPKFQNVVFLTPY